jgi:hypothetical protein
MEPHPEAIVAVSTLLSAPTLQLDHLVNLINTIRNDFLTSFAPTYHGPYPERGESIQYMNAWNAALHQPFFRGEMRCGTEKSSLFEEEAFTLNAQLLILDHANNMQQLTNEEKQERYKQLINGNYSDVTNFIRLARLVPRIAYTTPRTDRSTDFYGKQRPLTHFDRPDTIRVELIRSYYDPITHMPIALKKYNDKRKMQLQ